MARYRCSGSSEAIELVPGIVLHMEMTLRERMGEPTDNNPAAFASSPCYSSQKRPSVLIDDEEYPIICHSFEYQPPPKDAKQRCGARHYGTI